MAITTSAKCGNTWMSIVKGNYQGAYVESEQRETIKQVTKAEQIKKAQEVTKFLIKAGYDKIKTCEILVKGGDISSDLAEFYITKQVIPVVNYKYK